MLYCLYKCWFSGLYSSKNNILHIVLVVFMQIRTKIFIKRIIASAADDQRDKFQSSFHLHITKRPLTLSGLRYLSHPFETLNLLQLNLTKYLRCSPMFMFFTDVLRYPIDVFKTFSDDLRYFQMFSIPSIHCRIIFGKYWQAHSHLAKSLLFIV